MRKWESEKVGKWGGQKAGRPDIAARDWHGYQQLVISYQRSAYAGKMPAFPGLPLKSVPFGWQDRSTRQVPPTTEKLA